MIEQPSDVTDPIVVNARPGRDQVAAGLRQFLSALGLIAATLGMAKQAGVLGQLAAIVDPAVTVVGMILGVGAVVIGQLKTRALSKKAAAMASKLPDHIAHTK